MESGLKKKTGIVQGGSDKGFSVLLLSGARWEKEERHGEVVSRGVRCHLLLINRLSHTVSHCVIHNIVSGVSWGAGQYFYQAVCI